MCSVVSSLICIGEPLTYKLLKNPASPPPVANLGWWKLISWPGARMISTPLIVTIRSVQPTQGKPISATRLLPAENEQPRDPHWKISATSQVPSNPQCRRLWIYVGWLVAGTREDAMGIMRGHRT